MERYTVTGMTCAACSARVEKAVSQVEGVTACSVSLLTNSMGVEGNAAPEAVIAAVEKAGYGAAREGDGTKTEARAGNARASDALADRETPKLFARFLASLCFLLPLLYISMGHMLWHRPLPPFLAEDHAAAGLAQLLLCVCVMVINQRFFVSGAKSLWHRAPNMDALVAIGAAAAFLYSVVVLFYMIGTQNHAGDLYFESAAMILTLITLGKCLEARAKGKTTDALRGLMDLAPKTATLLRDGKEVTVPVEQVKKGDRFVVRPGESVPVDGVVSDGGGAVDE